MERPEKASKIWILFILLPIFGGLFLYLSNNQSISNETEINSLKKEIDSLNEVRMENKELKVILESQQIKLDEQETQLDQNYNEIINLKNSTNNENSFSSEEKLKLELELQKKITIISDLNNEVMVLENEITVLTKQNDSLSSNSEVNENSTDEQNLISANSNNLTEDNGNNAAVINATPPTPYLLKSSPPQYPSRALQRNLTGEVTLMFDIDQNGMPVNIRVLSSSSRLFEQSAIDAISKSVYSRTVDQNGSPTRYIDMKKKYSWKLQ
jgi:TonB family protein